MAIDPICNMTVDPTTAKFKTIHDGTDVYFCSQHCLTKFKKKPNEKRNFLNIQSQNNQLATTSVEGKAQNSATAERYQQAKLKGTLAPINWTCPMDPEVIQNHPGSCPKCGMALEPMGISVSEDMSEYHDMKKRFIVATLFTIPLMFLAMGDMLPAHPVSTLFSHDIIRWGQLVLATPIIFWSAWPFFVRAYHSVINHSLNMFTLIGLGVGVAYS